MSQDQTRPVSFDGAVFIRYENAPTSATIPRRPTFKPVRVDRPTPFEGAWRYPALVNSEVYIECTLNVPKRFTLVRAPEGHYGVGNLLQSTEKGFTFTPSKPGLFVIRHNVGLGYHREFEFVALETQTWRGLAQWGVDPSRVDRVMAVTHAINDERCTRERLIAAIELYPVGGYAFPRIWGDGVGISLTCGCGGPFVMDEIEKEQERIAEDARLRRQKAPPPGPRF